MSEEKAEEYGGDLVHYLVRMERENTVVYITDIMKALNLDTDAVIEMIDECSAHERIELKVIQK